VADKTNQQNDLERFEQFVQVVKLLIESKGASVRIISPNRIRVSVNEDRLAPLLIERKLPEEEFRSALNSEITPILSAVLGEAESPYIQMAEMQTPVSVDVVDKARRAEVLRQKIQCVKAALVTPEIVTAYFFKNKNLNKIFGQVSWKISVRRQQHEKLDLSPFPHATLQLTLHQPGRASQDSAFWVYSLIGSLASRGDEIVTFECDTGDLDDLIAELTKLRELLKSQT
jgi:hypothetical protein